jgi:small subunit ribosomal protein S21
MTLAEVAVGFANAMHVKCIAPPVRTVGRRRRYLFSRTVTDPCIAVTVISRNVAVARTTDDRAGNFMTEILVNSGDSFEWVLKRFKRKVQEAGILSEARRRSHYESPQARRKRKAEAQRRRRRRPR